MNPLRAFTLAFMVGTFLLFGGYGLVSAASPPRIGHTITV